MSQKLKTKDIDLLVVYKKKKEPSKYASSMKYILPPIILTVIIAIFYGVMFLNNRSIQKDIDEKQVMISELKEKIANDPNVAKDNTLKGLIANTKKLKDIQNDIQSYPVISQRVFDQILIAAGTKTNITSFTYTRTSQIIAISIESKGANDAENFVRALKATDEFREVSYSGYSLNEKQAANSDEKQTNNTTQATAESSVYVATIACVLK